MRFDTQKAFPYPVLRPENDDYKESEFQAATVFKMEKDSKKVRLEISYAISSVEIENEIRGGYAEYVSIISCRDTYFRSVLSTGEKKQNIEFDIGLLRGEVRIEPYVVVRKEIPIFSSPDINLEFGAGPFRFSVGDILAQDEAQVFYIDRDYFKPVTSVFDLVKKEGLYGAEWTLAFDQDHVQIEVSPAMKEKIDNARNSQINKAILINSIYFAAVMQAIQKLKDTGQAGEFDSYRWTNVILNQIHNNGWDIASIDSYLLAERLLKYPLSLLNIYIFKGSE
jgi:hypothetical protein